MMMMHRTPKSSCLCRCRLKVCTGTSAGVLDTAGCLPPKGASLYEEYAICELGALPQGALGTPNQVLRTITVTSDPSTAGANYPPSCGAFIYSAVGDIDKTNNYKAWK